ncbi:DoxX family membrane protein [Rhodococcus hoagii]|uniref:DoxX family protein n=1 Tax=Rhodococcus hoagii TaxID=43767 RepID=UPI0019D9DE09|nr:DoxX family protein [Prescottella equi]NKV32684.1 DoxX family membrane protein [Prescottella equi]BCN79604.1 membrane protein [Prescottella equi]
MTDKPREHPASTGQGTAPSPFDQPTERFPAQSVRPSIPRTDDDFDPGADDLSSLPTEQLPVYRPAANASAPPVVDDQVTEVIARPEPTVSEPIVSGPTVSEPIVSEPVTVAAPVAVSPQGPPPESTEQRRGTLDVGLFVLRLAVGGTLLAHGLQKLTGWWNGPGLGGYRDDLVTAGFDHARALAVAGAVGEVAGGALLILGLLTPFAGAAVLAVMINAWCLKQSALPGLEYFAPDGVEYETLLGAAAAAIVLTGPGRIALDGRRKWATRPHVGSVVILLVGVAAGLTVWFVFNGANPVI